MLKFWKFIFFQSKKYCEGQNSGYLGIFHLLPLHMSLKMDMEIVAFGNVDNVRQFHILGNTHCKLGKPFGNLMGALWEQEPYTIK
jgi:hypothetical protein